MIKAASKRAIRLMLESAGYRVYHRDVLPYGIEYMLDIERLATKWGLLIRTFFDVGANVGQTSSLALSSFGQANIFAFEPNPTVFAKLTDSIGDHPRLTTCNLALSNTRGKVPFFDYSSSTLGSLIPNAQYPMRRGVSPRQIIVDCTTLDDFCDARHIHEIDVLKVDVEGIDLQVLQGGRRVVAAGGVRFVYVEFNDMSPRSGSCGGALTPISDFLSPFGFRFIATYPDHMEFGDEMHVGANALFVRPPGVLTQAKNSNTD